MTTTPAERTRLRAAILEQLYPVALSMKLSPAQVTDLATRCLDSGKVFLTADDALVGWELPDLVESLQRDPANAHVFKTEESESKKSGGDDFQKKYGMSKTEFDKLPARRRLELANAATAAESKR